MNIKHFVKGIFKQKPIQKFTLAAFMIGGLSVVSSFLGLLRDRILASSFGASDTLDIYYAAFRLPDLVFNILIFGALSSSFVPIFSEYVANKKKEANEVANSILNLMLFFIISISVVGIIAAPYLLKIIVPGFSPEKLSITVGLTRIMFLSPIILSISGILSGILTTFKKFFMYSLAPVMYNAGIISGIYLFTPRWGIYGLALAVVFGALLHMLIQLPAAYACGFRLAFISRPQTRILKRISKLMLPRSLSLVVSQINLLLVTIIGSTLNSGSLAIFNLANNLSGIPLTIFGAPFAVAVFPDLAFAYNQKNYKDFARIFSLALTRIAFFVIPLTVAILVLRAQLVRLALGAGKFDWEATTTTLQVLGYLSLSLFFQSIIPLVSRAFFALHDTKTPFFSGLIASVINIGLAYYLGRTMGISGVALAFSVSQIITLVLMLVLLHVRLGALNDNLIISSITKISISTVAAGAVLQYIKYLVGTEFGTDTFLKVLAQTSLSFTGGAIIYICVAWYLGVREVSIARRMIKRILERWIFRTSETS